MADRPGQLHFPDLGHDDIATAVARAFEPSRLTQARLLADLTKAALAAEVHLSSAAIGQFESSQLALSAWESVRYRPRVV